MKSINHLSTAGLDKLRGILAEFGRANDDINAWASEVEEAASNRIEGESLSIELRGLRWPQGDTVFFDGVEADFEWDEFDDE